jgi:hypothetical protein
MSLAHPLSRYDDHFVLKVPPLLWITLLYALRHVILVGLSFMPKTAGMLEFLRHQIDPLLLLTDLPALLVIYAYSQRKPDAKSLVRGIWRAGRWLLVSSFALHFMLQLTFHYKTMLAYFQGYGGSVVLFALADLCALSYLLLLGSPLVRDVFADFPAPPAGAKSSPRSAG